MLLLIFEDDDEIPVSGNGASLTIPHCANHITLPVDAITEPIPDDAPAE